MEVARRFPPGCEQIRTLAILHIGTYSFGLDLWQQRGVCCCTALFTHFAPSIRSLRKLHLGCGPYSSSQLPYTMI